MKIIPIYAIVLVLLLVSCQKNVNELTLNDLINQKNSEVDKLMLEQLKKEDILSINNAVHRYKERNMIDSMKNKRLDYILKDEREIEKQIKELDIPYQIAIQELKKGLKNPLGAIIPKISIYYNDSLSFDFNEDSTLVTVNMKYAAQNDFGVYKSGIFNYKLRRDNPKKEWIFDDRVSCSLLFDGVLDLSFEQEKTTLSGMDTTLKKYQFEKSHENGLEKISIKGLEFYFAKTNKVEFYFSNNKIKKVIVNIPRGDRAVDIFQYITKDAKYSKENNKPKYIFHNAILSLNSHASAAELIFEYI